MAALVHEGRVLLVHRRPAREHHPDCWDLPGGHVEAGESADEAIRRECREELDIEVHHPVPVSRRCSNPELHKTVFLVTAWSGTPTNGAPDEHDDLGWFVADELAPLTLGDPATLMELGTLLRRNSPGTPSRGHLA